jgi:hypothetical protein
VLGEKSSAVLYAVECNITLLSLYYSSSLLRMVVLEHDYDGPGPMGSFIASVVRGRGFGRHLSYCRNSYP